MGSCGGAPVCRAIVVAADPRHEAPIRRTAAAASASCTARLRGEPPAPFSGG
jgi:hypothetical protein